MAADYIATCKCVNEEGDLLGLRLKDTSIDQSVPHNREEVLKLLEAGKEIRVQYTEGTDTKVGEKIRPYKLKWLRAVHDDLEEDNLGNMDLCKEWLDCAKLHLEREITQ